MIDESISFYEEREKKAAHLEQMELLRRMALERDLERQTVGGENLAAADSDRETKKANAKDAGADAADGAAPPVAAESQSALPALKLGSALQLANIVFDRSGNFLLFAGPLGVKVLNLHTNAVRRLIGLHESARFIQLALFQGVRVECARTAFGCKPLINNFLLLYK